MRTRAGAAVVTMAGLLLAGCAGNTAVHPRGQPSPRPLHLGSSDEPRAAAGAVAAGGYVTDVRLSPVAPGPAAAWTLRPDVTGEQVRRLADSLGLTGQPRHQGDAWVVDGPSGQLAVGTGPGAPWAFDSGGHACLPGATCESGGSVTLSSPAPPPPDAATTRRLAGPVLAAVGLGSAAAVVADGRVEVDPTVGGLPTSGFATVLSSVGTAGISNASGWLGNAARGAAYPRVSEEEGLARLRALPRPLFACAVQPGRPNPCAPHHITGVRPGLVLERDSGVPVLLPAWFFDLAGGQSPVAVLAVADRYLAQPAPPVRTPLQVAPGQPPQQVAPAQPPQQVAPGTPTGATP